MNIACGQQVPGCKEVLVGQDAVLDLPDLGFQLVEIRLFVDGSRRPEQGTINERVSKNVIFPKNFQYFATSPPLKHSRYSSKESI